MNVAQIENNLQLLVKSFNEQSFIYDLMLAYGQPKASIKRLKDGGLNLSKNNGEIIWKKKLFFKESKHSDLHDLIDDLRINDGIIKHSPRFIIVTDYKNLLARDTKTNDTLDIKILEIPQHFDFFLPLAGMEKAQHQFENPADVKAAERMGKLYDEIKKDNPTDTEEEVHNLNVFLTRLLFCFFSEDTNIFEKSQFTHSLVNNTQNDGSDLHTHFERLFQVMNTPENERGNIPVFLNSFPYVNGGLFRNQHNIPRFSRKSRQVIIESGELDWSAINPDIFGSMIQAVITPEHRGGLGMHYTSVPNIMKVIEPLFLNELNEEFEKSKYEPKKLYLLLERLSRIKIFDPACGSGNFLIIAYKELRQLEIKILNQLKDLQHITTGFEPKQLELIPRQQLTLASSFQIQMFSRVELSQFYGIELDDFAHEIAILSLWLSYHQMNVKFKEVFGAGNPTLPLQNGGNIVNGNACILNWEGICPKADGDEIYILGNPPYLGARLQNETQKNDMSIVFSGINGFNNLDYISCWFLKGKKYIEEFNSKFAFVTTSSVCQGTQVPLLWVNLIDDITEIDFAYQAFKWKNNAKANAGVAVMIVGLRNITNKPKFLFSENIKLSVPNISPFITSSENIYILDRSTNISKLPEMTYGSMPNDDGYLILNEDEKNELISIYPQSINFIKRFIGAAEFLDSVNKFCIWVSEHEFIEASQMEMINNRFNSVRIYRLKSKREATKKLASRPYQFGEVRYKNTPFILIPQTSSENREYIPIGFFPEGIIVSNAARVIYDASFWLFAILTSKMHNIWVRAVAGRLETRIQYSNSLCYNTFPFPQISNEKKNQLSQFAKTIIEQREKFSEKTLSQLYDTGKMPVELMEAHQQLDLAIEKIYRIKPFDNDEERLAYLFKLYEQMINDEKTKGTLFEMESKPKKKKK